jgi:YD repeat-containing protein
MIKKWLKIKIVEILLISCLMIGAPIISLAATVTYSYDDLYRLVQVVYVDGSISTTTQYEYDAAGNMLSTTTTLQDTDDDGLPDILEVTTCTETEDADTDDDGLLDGEEDLDGDGEVDADETDPCELDTDFDGLQDGTELGITLDDIGLYTDTDVFQPDLDPATTTDPLDEDTDGDGISDGDEDFNFNGRFDEGESDPAIRDTRPMPWIPILLE